MTHDLMLNMIVQMGYRVQKVEINELSKDTYFATIFLQLADRAGLDLTKSIDSRPSDAIALALRAKAPIYVSAQVVADGTHAIDSEKDEREAQEFKDFLSNVNASDFKS